MVNKLPTLGALAMCMMCTIVRCAPQDCDNVPSAITRNGCTLTQIFEDFLTDVDLINTVDDWVDFCNIHDVCYHCAATVGGSTLDKNECDKKLRKKLLSVCGNDYYCKFVAHVLYVGAWKHGDATYNTETNTAECYDPSVSACLNLP